MLLDPAAGDALRQGFAHFGPQGPALLEQVLAAIRQALAASIHEMFLLGTVVVAVAWASVFFLREVPLRRSHDTSRQVVTEAGQQLAASELATDVPPLPTEAKPVLVERGDGRR